MSKFAAELCVLSTSDHPVKYASSDLQDNFCYI